MDCCTSTTVPTAVINPRSNALLIKLSKNPNLKRPNANVNRPAKSAAKLAMAATASGPNGCLAVAC